MPQIKHCFPVDWDFVDWKIVNDLHATAPPIMETDPDRDFRTISRHVIEGTSRAHDVTPPISLPTG